MPAPKPKFQSLSVQIGEAIAHLRLVRPALGNRFDETGHSEFAAALDLLASSEETRVVILSAEGRHFSAGGDFEDIVAAGQSEIIRARMSRVASLLFHRLVALPMPVIAAVQGAAIGLGATIVSLCDITVAFRDAKIGDPHVQLGIVAGDGGIIGWSQSVGMNRAKRYLLTGDYLTAGEAHAMGLITDLANSPEEVLPKCMEIAQRLVALPRGGVEGTKRAFLRLTQQTALTAFDVGLAYEMQSMTSPDVAATVEKLKRPR
ncbi:MAG: enoyl-CoA hydratase/isomerase family protein [Gammaproteobacteria bacterium]